MPPESWNYSSQVLRKVVDKTEGHSVASTSGVPGPMAKRIVTYSPTPDPSAAAGPQPPRPGLTSCAGKIKGRYSSSAGLGGLTIEFRSGKATLKGPLVDDEVVDCWTTGTKIVLHNPKEADDLELDINKDGSIDTPFGEIKKKGD